MTYNFKNIHKFLKLHHKGGVRCCVENTAFLNAFIDSVRILAKSSATGRTCNSLQPSVYKALRKTVS